MENTKTGISKAIFVVGLIVVLVASVAASYAISSIVIKVGPKGDKGDKGDQGIQGIQGERGGIEAYVSGALTSTYHDVWMGTDYRCVRGYLINFGNEPAYNVKVKLTWWYSGGSYSKTQSVGTLAGYKIYNYVHDYYWEGSAGSLTYEITWD